MTTKMQESMPLPLGLPERSSFVRHFFFFKEKMIGRVISVAEWKEFCGKHFLFKVCIKSGEGREQSQDLEHGH